MSKEKVKSLDQQVEESLQVYRLRGEFENTRDLEALKQARSCLELAGYEWSPTLAAAVRRVLGVPRQSDYPPEVLPYVRRLNERIDAGDLTAYSELTRLAAKHVSQEY